MPEKWMFEMVRTDPPSDLEVERLERENELQEGDVVDGKFVRKESRGLWSEGVRFKRRYIKPEERSASKILDDIANG